MKYQPLGLSLGLWTTWYISCEAKVEGKVRTWDKAVEDLRTWGDSDGTGTTFQLFKRARGEPWPGDGAGERAGGLIFEPGEKLTYAVGTCCC